MKPLRSLLLGGAVLLGAGISPAEAAWNSSVTLSLPAGTTLQQALDQLKAHGFRWALRDGKLYVVK